MAYDLKSESDVKEYLKNLGIEYRFGCYSEKKPEEVQGVKCQKGSQNIFFAIPRFWHSFKVDFKQYLAQIWVCHLLADFLEAIKKDFEKAAKVYRNNCDEYNFAKSCLKYGAYCLTGKGAKKSDYRSAYDYFEKGCNLNEPFSCFNQAVLLVTKNDSLDVKQDVVKGATLLEKSCAAENGMACHYLSSLYIVGAKNGSAIGETKEKDNHDIPRNMEMAFKYALEGCKLGNMYSCANVSQMYAKGDGVEKNEEMSMKYKSIVLETQNEITKPSEALKFGLGLD